MEENKFNMCESIGIIVLLNILYPKGFFDDSIGFKERSDNLRLIKGEFDEYRRSKSISTKKS